MKNKKQKAQTKVGMGSGHRSELHELVRGRARRFEDSRTRRAGQKLQREIRRELD
ncbi:hypothetical protein ACMT4L_03070 [Deinococcus sp. A31D244]|uniref:hypothetical protein n=1 Tax=Deinococcus TaxID=1298 RepID=UPI0039E16572